MLITNDNYRTATPKEWENATGVLLVDLPEFNQPIHAPKAWVWVRGCPTFNQLIIGGAVWVWGCEVYNQPTKGNVVNVDSCPSFNKPIISDYVKVDNCQKYNQPTTGVGVKVFRCPSYNQPTKGHSALVLNCPLYDHSNTVILSPLKHEGVLCWYASQTHKGEKIQSCLPKASAEIGKKSEMIWDAGLAGRKKIEYTCIKCKWPECL